MSNPFSGRACVHGLHLKHISHCSPISKHGSDTTATVKQNDVTQEFIPSCSSHSDANYVCCGENILESGAIFARLSFNFQLSTLDTLFSTILCCPWLRDRWLPTKSPFYIMGRAYKRKACLSICLSVSTFSFFEYSIIWWFRPCKPCSDPVPLYTDLVPQISNQCLPLLTRYNQVPTGTALYWPSTAK